MYDIIQQIIDHSWTTGTNEQSYIYYICGALIVLITCVIIDMVYRIFSHFWHG